MFLKNPTLSEVEDLFLQFGPLHVIQGPKGDLYVWPSYLANPGEMAERLKLGSEAESKERLYTIEDINRSGYFS